VAGGNGGGPGPLKVEAAEMAGDVDGFSYEEEAGYGSRFHGSGVEPRGIDAACCDFRFFKSFCAGGVEGPVMQSAVGRFEDRVRPALRSGDRCKVSREAVGQHRLQCVPKAEGIAAGSMLEQGTEKVLYFWREVDVD